MQAKIEKLGEGRYVLKDTSDDKRITVPMTRKQIRALVLEAMYGPKVDLLLTQADEEYGQQVDFEEVTAGDSTSMGPPSLPTAKDDTDFVVADDEKQDPK